MQRSTSDQTNSGRRATRVQILKVSTNKPVHTGFNQSEVIISMGATEDHLALNNAIDDSSLCYVMAEDRCNKDNSADCHRFSKAPNSLHYPRRELGIDC